MSLLKDDEVFHRNNHRFGRLISEKAFDDTTYWIVEAELSEATPTSVRTLRIEFWNANYIILVKSDAHRLYLRLKYSV